MVLTMRFPAAFIRKVERKVNKPLPKMTMSRAKGRIERTWFLSMWKILQTTSISRVLTFSGAARVATGPGEATAGADLNISSMIGWTRLIWIEVKRATNRAQAKDRMTSFFWRRVSRKS